MIKFIALTVAAVKTIFIPVTMAPHGIWPVDAMTIRQEIDKACGYEQGGTGILSWVYDKNEAGKVEPVGILLKITCNGGQ